MLFDAMIRWATVESWGDITFRAADILAPGRTRKGISRILFGAIDRARQVNLNRSLEPKRVALAAMLKAYAGLGSAKWTVSPTRIRQLMDAAEQAGAVWPPASYVLIDRAVAADPAVWNCEGP